MAWTVTCESLVPSGTQFPFLYKPHVGSRTECAGLWRVRAASCSVLAQAQFSVSRCRFPPLPAGIVIFHNTGLWRARRGAAAGMENP